MFNVINSWATNDNDNGSNEANKIKHFYITIL